MESHCCCEDHKDPAEREVRDNTSELRFEEGREDQLGRPKRDGDESPAGDITLENFKSTACPEGRGAETRWQRRGQLKKTNSWKMVRFQEPSLEEDVAERDSSAESLFPEYVVEEWTTISFEQLFLKEDWQHLTDDRLVRKKVLEPAGPSAPRPIWGQQVTVKMQAVLEDRTVVEKDAKLSFIIGEGDVSQALEECVLSMCKGEIALLLADSQYTYGLLGREPDIPACAAMLYQLQLLDVRDKANLLNLPLSDRIRLGNHKRERGNFYFQRDEYGKAARAYCMALDVLTTCGQDAVGGAKEEAKEEAQEVRDYRVKCLNNLATAQLKLEKCNEALHASRDVLALDPDNVKALYRAGKILSDLGDYAEAMELLKKALKLEPATKAIHAELSKLVRRQPAAVLCDNGAPFLLLPSKQTTLNISWKLILAALAVALASLVTSVILTVRT
ncbi:peptidyl-prolyl cis-trans isomerase FKBP8-like [Syngnathus typhle]|uniref:FKBP prolyl isomerase 16 n=1 Tax=Syngnathus typhle TaxID=161592 RepID=UPI002A6AEA45|nr:FKBP prolyl isomerase 16 [Syngnathus typhle]XP_061138355.1 peptidyl-prolyl cis-trans isomerase FKBP8-like [Syngnathus typhle]